MRYSIRTVTPADAIDPVIDLAEAKAHLRVDMDDDDALIEALVLAAQDHVERHTGQVLTEREMEMACRGFLPACAGAGLRGDSAFEIPRAPVTAIDAIAYTDGDGVAAALAEADWRWSESAPGLVLPAYGTSWPGAYDEEGSVRIAFTAGYEVGLAPASLVAAVKLMLGSLYANRESAADQMPHGVAALCAPYRRVSI